MRRCLSLCLIVLMFILSACTQFSLDSRIESAQQLVTKSGWVTQTISTSYFPIRTFSETPRTVTELTIYIEGDGLAWITRSKPSSDPTPIDPLALKLALADTRNTAAYIGRPCQYVKSASCEQRYWTSARFAPEVIDAMDAAVSRLKKQFQAENLRLVGYSGGGAVAALVAARRHDVIQLVTVAGNLDHTAWTNLHHISPLTESLNAADYWQKLVNIQQVHFVGVQDQTVPHVVASSYQARFPYGQRPDIKVIDVADHHCCWVKQWPKLIESLK